jgi:hypothetical protein
LADISGICGVRIQEARVRHLNSRLVAGPANGQSANPALAWRVRPHVHRQFALAFDRNCEMEQAEQGCYLLRIVIL